MACISARSQLRGFASARLVAGAGSSLQPVLDPQPGYCCVAFSDPGR